MKLLATILLIVLTKALTIQAQTVIHVNPDKKYQIIDGWEAVGNSMESTSVRDTLMPFLNELIDLAVNEVGITRLRFSYKSGMEDTVDYFRKVLDGDITYDEFKLHRYSKINDNDDPFLINPSGFQMSGLDHNVQNLVLPFKKAVEENGGRFYFNLCYVDFADQSEFHHSDDPEEYAEFMSYAWKYMDSIYNFTPDGLEIILEPDNADVWNQKLIPGVIAATGRRLESLGYDPEIIAPSVMNLRNIPLYFQSIADNQEALSYLDVLSYHRYSGNDDTIAQKEIVRIAEENNLKTAMLEYDKNGDVNELHYDLKYNNVVSWTKYALMYKSDEKFAYVFVDASDSSNPKFGICQQTKYLRQYFKFIKPGAQRVEVAGSSNRLDPVAFVNLDGTQVVVIKADTGDDVLIEGLIPGEYGIKYTLGNYDWATAPSQYNIDLQNQTISNGEILAFNIPDKGVATVYGVSKSTGISETGGVNNNISVFPNPASSYLTVNYYSGFPQKFILTNFLGEEVISGDITQNNKNIDLTRIAQGLYFLRIRNKCIKIIKQ